MRGARIGFIGLGIMGSRMAANLARAGRPLTVWTRTRENGERFAAEHGVALAPSPAALAAASDIVITMVVDGEQVERLLLGPGSVAEGAGEGLLCVDMSTIAPAASRRIGAALAEREIAFVDAPVTGSAPRAADGTLTIMVGGEPAAVERARPVLEELGSLVVHVGPLGQGESVKLINNALAAANATALAEALVLARAEGLEPGPLLEVLAAGSGASTMLALKAGPMLERDFTTLFKTEHMLKDLRYCLQEAAEAGVAFPAAEHALELLAAAAEAGHGERDFASIVTVAERGGR